MITTIQLGQLRVLHRAPGVDEPLLVLERHTDGWGADMWVVLKGSVRMKIWEDALMSKSTLMQDAIDVV